MAYRWGFYKDNTLISPAELDDKICEHLGVKPDPDTFHKNWFDTFGLLAVGEEPSLTVVREQLEEIGTEKAATQIAILDYLQKEGLELRAWRE